MSVLLRGLKAYSNDITAIVAVTDDGSSSGIIRKEFDMLPPGDIRKCISALSYDEDLISSLMEYRFEKNNSSLSGHTLGNIWLTALTKYFGSFEQALEKTTTIFKTAGRVLPATLENIELEAKYQDGTHIKGESRIPSSGKKIQRVYLSKENVKPYEKAVEAIETADLIIIGPGSLYTSVIPNLLINGISGAIRENKKGVKVYIVNCSTERGETEDYTVDDHIRAIEKHSGGGLFDYCLVNNKVLKRSEKSSNLGEINNITTKKKQIFDYRIISKNVVNDKKPLYHDSEKLAKSVVEIYNEFVASSK